MVFKTTTREIRPFPGDDGPQPEPGTYSRRLRVPIRQVIYPADGSEASAERGPWRLGLDMPRYVPVLSHADDRQLRETLYRAHVSRASSRELDNTPLIQEILELRQQQAQRLGYAHWAELSLFKGDFLF